MLTPLQIIRDLQSIIGDAPREFTFSGSVYTGRITAFSKTRTLEVGGFDVEPLFTLVVALKDNIGNPTFVERPKTGDTIQIESITYRVVRDETDPHESMLTLDLGTPDK